jgi:hypothetical protein
VHIHNVPAVPHDLRSASRRIQALSDLQDEYLDGEAPAWIAAEIRACSAVVRAGYAMLTADCTGITRLKGI